ncbi:hypothetical protein [Novosphingobium sp.]|uniref:hypothetical protein n=1 Tax=Novosphingobium sp. TaxID=1874826 RepID=UPI0025E0547D|nr:hypothetical protein [Novosphingobium sp.]
MTLTPLLRSALIDVSTIMAPARHDWWIIGSAALALHGFDPGPVGDVDVLLDPRDFQQVLAPLAIDSAAGGDADRFRSDMFATWYGGALPVELFAGFSVREGQTWQQVALRRRQPVDLDGQRLWVPPPAELHALLLRFGREKDLARAALISPSGRFPSRSGTA